MSGTLDDNHGSTERNDSPASAMGAETRDEPTLDAAAAAPVTMGEDGSDLSLELSPEKPTSRSGGLQRQKPAPRASTPSRRPPLVRSIAGKTRVRAKSFDTGSAERASSPAIRRLPLHERQVVAPESESLDARVKALETQQRIDHAYIGELVKTVQEVMNTVEADHRKAAEFTQMGLDLRKEVFTVKHELHQIAGIAHDQFIKTRIERIEHIMTAMETHIVTVAEREGRVEQCVSEMHGSRPREAEAIHQALKAQSTEISQVKDLVNMFEGYRAAQTVVTTVPTQPELTPAMRATLDDMYNEIKQIKSVNVGSTLLQDRLTIIGSNVDTMRMEQSAVQHRVEQIEAQMATHTDALFQVSACGLGYAAVAPAQSAGCCGNAAYTATSAGQWNGAGPLGYPQPGGHGSPTPGSSGDGDPLGILRAVIGGNGNCHCVHVKEVIEKVAALERRAGPCPSPAGPRGGDPLLGRDPWGGARRGDTSPAGPQGDEGPRDAQGRRLLPLALRGPLGAIAYKERALFDDKLALTEEYRFNGVKGGPAWKGKLERYFISKAPVLQEILLWAEEGDAETITMEKFKEAVGNKLTEEQVIVVNAAIWGFLSSSVSGSAETMFKGAKPLNGIDAWRRLVRYIEHGKAIRLETLRREIKMLHLRQISSLEKVEEGVAEFDNTLQEYVLAGGTAPTKAERKSDLLAILPGEMRETLLWKASDDSEYEDFRDHVVAQTAKILLNRRKPIHAVEASPGPQGEDDGGDDDGFTNIASVDDLLAALNRLNRGGQRGRGQLQPRDRGDRGRPAPTAPDTFRGKRKCPNCGEEHAERRCPKPAIPVSDRKCFECLEKGHSARDCPTKKKGNSIRAIVDRPTSELNGFFMVDDDGYQSVRPGRQARPRPMPTQATLGDFISPNPWDALSVISDSLPTNRVIKSKTQTFGSTKWGASISRVQYHSGTTSSSSTPQSTATATASTTRPTSGGHQRHPPPDGEARDRGRAPENRVNEDVDVDFQPIDHPEPPVEWRRAVAEAVDAAQQILKAEEESTTNCGSINLLCDSDDAMIAAATEKVTIRPAIDSGSVDNVIHPCELPADANPVPNDTDSHFVGANNSRIEKFGTCTTRLDSECGQVGCDWQLADVTRPLHSVSKVTGPRDGPGKQDVLFSNTKAVVVPPGIVTEILKRVKPVAVYEREGNLYVGKFEMSAFGRQSRDR